MGLYYAGSTQKVQDLTLKATKKIKHPLDLKTEPRRDLKVYEVEGASGKAEIGVEQDGNEYYLWLIDPKSGFSTRT